MHLKSKNESGVAPSLFNEATALTRQLPEPILQAPGLEYGGKSMVDIVGLGVKISAHGLMPNV
ncbi:MAG TPA: hypothetical protein PKD66_13655 [Azonexus sp.]|nr:hypothetical protein [Azonexus sp.]